MANLAAITERLCATPVPLINQHKTMKPSAAGRPPPIAAVLKKGLDSRLSKQDIGEFRRQIEKGSIQKAYRGLLSYMMGLRTHFMHRFGASAVSGLYQGYLDMTYFALFPPSLQSHDLKVAIVFNYDAFRFEAWLAARNRKIQRQYWELFKDSQRPDYRVVAPAEGVDSILERDLAVDFDLNAPDDLTATIENRITAFVEDIEGFLEEAHKGPTRAPVSARCSRPGARKPIANR